MRWGAISAWLPALVLGSLHVSIRAADGPAGTLVQERVEVIGTSPLPGLGTPLRDVPANVQVFGSRDLQGQHRGSLSEFLEANPSSVTVNSAQGNPYQTDISFRGFTASPLLGVPQGLSVFQDGVRINEPFGDVVNWDLLPQSAIATIQLIPGSNPLFGLNTLGGALTIQTKSGSHNPGTAVEVSGGSFGRRTSEFEHGGASGDWNWFATANLSDERGWARHNPSQVRQFFGKLGYQTAATDLDLSLTSADNRLQGTQTLPRSWADTPRDAYTFPDTSRNRMAMLTAKASQSLGRGLLLGGTAYLRRYRNGSLSSDVNDGFGDVDPTTGAVDAVQALNDRSGISQDSGGLGMQLTASRPVAGLDNELVAGGSADFGRADFTQDAQPAMFDAQRDAVAIGDFQPVTRARTRNRTLAAFAADTLALTTEWAVTASGRFNEASVRVRDASGKDPALDGDHAFRRFNPALGATYSPSPALTAYANYNEGMRAPTAIELTCADPLAPCKLPNSFLADPPLAPVVARTFELGGRGTLGDWHWSAAAYRSDVANDIQFVSSGNGINAGYFSNVGRTRRQGLELMLATGSASGARLSLRLALIDATYLAGFTEHSPNNATADAAGDIAVSAGAHLPGIPREALRVRADSAAWAGWHFGASLQLNSATFARGDENNRSPGGRVGGYGLVDLDATCQATSHAQFFARVNNVFDRRYANFGILGQDVFANASRSFDPDKGTSEAFLGQGAPRGGWAGVRFEWP